MRKKADFEKEMKKKTWVKVENILKGNLDSIPSLENHSENSNYENEKNTSNVLTSIFVFAFFTHI